MNDTSNFIRHMNFFAGSLLFYVTVNLFLLDISDITVSKLEKIIFEYGGMLFLILKFSFSAIFIRLVYTKKSSIRNIIHCCAVGYGGEFIFISILDGMTFLILLYTEFSISFDEYIEMKSKFADFNLYNWTVCFLDIWFSVVVGIILSRKIEIGPASAIVAIIISNYIFNLPFSLMLF